MPEFRHGTPSMARPNAAPSGISFQYPLMLSRGFGAAAQGRLWPQADIGIVLWSLSVSSGDWQTSEKLTRLCTIPEPATLTGAWDRSAYALEARILRPLLWFGLLEYRSEKLPDSRFETLHYYRKA